MKKLLVAMLMCIALVACTKKNKEVETSSSDNATPVAKNANQEVYVYNWSEYIPDEVLQQFEKETGIKVVYTTYDSNEAMYAKLKVLGGEGYDVTFPSTYYIKKMSDEGLIQKIDKSKLKNYKDFIPAVINQPFDPNNEYSVPFMWGTTGIGVNTKYVDPAKVTSWKDLWNPEFKGKLMLQNDVREVFHMALKSLGYSGNTTNPKEIEVAYEELKKIMPSVRLFNSDSPKIPFLNEEVYVGMIWGGEAFRANQENPNIKFVYPKDGVALWMDNMVIPAKAKNVDNALVFIDFILRPDISAQISDASGYMSPLVTSKEHLDEVTKNSRIIFPIEEDLVNSEMQDSVGDAITTYQSFWEKLKVD